ncbi:MAG TPA: carboxypeptidase-like regulatory domain-containing protein, partial [candidate division Zixibacteria bacterium]|nr:carboxypeptidase-like regulatory domain-containing protein [candidate division Zixibacteria bacterium]
MRFKKFTVLFTLTFATLFLFTAGAWAAGSISGQVKLEHEFALVPVVGASVAAISEDSHFVGLSRVVDTHFVAMARTDSDGNYRIDNLLAGNYRVIACKVDLGCLFYPGTRHPDSAGLVAVLDGEITSGIDFTFRPFVPPPPDPALIIGRITDGQTGEGIPNAWVGASGEFLTIIFETRT